MRLVLVEWVDSGGFSGWHSLKEIKGTGVKRCRSVGWLIQETDDCLWVVPHLDDAEPETEMVPMGKGDLCIPRMAVTRLISLKEDV